MPQLLLQQLRKRFQPGARLSLVSVATSSFELLKSLSRERTICGISVAPRQGPQSRMSHDKLQRQVEREAVYDEYVIADLTQPG